MKLQAHQDTKGLRLMFSIQMSLNYGSLLVKCDTYILLLAQHCSTLTTKAIVNTLNTTLLIIIVFL